MGAPHNLIRYNRKYRTGVDRGRSDRKEGLRLASVDQNTMSVMAWGTGIYTSAFQHCVKNIEADMDFAAGYASGFEREDRMQDSDSELGRQIAEMITRKCAVKEGI